MRSAVRWSVRGIWMIAAVAAVLALLSLAVMVLWNALVPELFHGPSLQYGQAFGLLLLSRILVGGLRGRRRMWRERWESMTPEERARMREHFQRRCAHRAEPPAPQASPPGT